MKTLDKVLLILGVFFLLFVAADFYVFLKTNGGEPTMLVGGVVAVVLGEIIACLRIKMGKIRQSYADKNENRENI